MPRDIIAYADPTVPPQVERQVVADLRELRAWLEVNWCPGPMGCALGGGHQLFGFDTPRTLAVYYALVGITPHVASVSDRSRESALALVDHAIARESR